MDTHYILQLETATQVCSAAVSANGEAIAFADVDEPNMHASKLTLLVGELLQKTGLKFDDLSAVAVSKGPGSYTGLRIGVSTAKGFCYATDLPLISIDTLNGMAAGFIAASGGDLRANTLLCPMIDARRMEVYTAVYDNDLRLNRPTEAVIVNERTFEYLEPQQQIVLFGSGADKLASLFAGHPRVEVRERFKNSASHLSRAAYGALLEKQFVNLAYFEPYYLKDFVATTPKK